MLSAGQRQSGVVAKGMLPDSSAVDNKALDVNVLLPGKLQGHNLLQMPEADIQAQVAEAWCVRGLVLKKQKGSGVTEK